MSDLLCFRAFDKVYGIPLDMVQESFDEQKVTPVPCLNHLFAGLCNHNGVIYPVLSFSRLCDQNIPDTRCCMLLLTVEGISLILRMNDVPSIVYEKDMEKYIPYDSGHGRMKISCIAQKGDLFIYQIDMKPILDELAKTIVELKAGE